MHTISLSGGDTRIPVLEVGQLCVAISGSGKSLRRVVDCVDFKIHAGEIVALVGESGSGKTMIGRSILQLLPAVARIESGTIRFCGMELFGASGDVMRAMRGREIGMVFQEPLVSLNPAITVGKQMVEALELHSGIGGDEARTRCLKMLERVRIHNPAACFDAYPHQFSGGMRQRIMLASVMVMQPKLLIADEPTTALDSLSQKEVMEILQELTRDAGTAVLLVSHDLSLVAHYSSRVVVLRSGKVVEAGSTAAMMRHPEQEYTRALLASLPFREDRGPAKQTGSPLIQIRGLCVEYERPASRFWKKASTTRAVCNVDLDVYQGETLAVVGESGCGKSTMGRSVLRLTKYDGGSISFKGRDIANFDKREMNNYRCQTQMVFQDPFSALDPRMNLLQIVAEGLRNIANLMPKERLERAAAMLEEVGVPRSFASRFPHELSGGQRQRICIARAIIGMPSLIVADEPVAALDLTIQKQILSLLERLQNRFGFTYLFISHDLGVVEQIADRVAVMYRGRIVEIGSRAAIYENPQHPYTLKLLQATPRLARTAGGAYHLAAHPARQRAAPADYVFFEANDMNGGVESTVLHHMVQVGDDHSVACVLAPG